MSEHFKERKTPTTDPTAPIRWRDCLFCGAEWRDNYSFITEKHDWLQDICDECKKAHQEELREEVAAGTPQLAHLIDDNAEDWETSMQRRFPGIAFPIDEAAEEKQQGT